MGKKIIWTNHAIAELNEFFLQLLEQSQSIETTIRVIDEVHESTLILATNPEIYKVDPLRLKNKGNAYRISYLIEDEAVYIIRVRYARKEPLEYK